MSTNTRSSDTTAEDLRPAPPDGFVRRWVLDFHNRTVLFRIGNWIFTTYAFLAGLAFATGFGVSLWFNAIIGVDVVYMAKLYLFLVVPAVLVGMRSFSIMLEWRELFRRPLQTLIKPGYMLHGGIAGGFVALVAIKYMTGLPLLAILDGPAFAMPLGEAIARLGCYVYGCCWGRPTQSSFGVRYTSPDSKVVRCAPHLQNVKIHPAQLYALVVYLGVFALFYALLPYHPFAGFYAGLYFVLHSVIRLSLEYFRQDDRGKLWGKITHTNLYSITMIVVGTGWLLYGARYGDAPVLDLSVRFVHVLFDESIMPWIAMYGVVLGSAYGVHFGKVGSWLSDRSGGMKPHVDELSMGAVSRMEAGDRNERRETE